MQGPTGLRPQSPCPGLPGPSPAPAAPSLVGPAPSCPRGSRLPQPSQVHISCERSRSPWVTAEDRRTQHSITVGSGGGRGPQRHPSDVGSWRSTPCPCSAPRGPAGTPCRGEGLAEPGHPALPCGLADLLTVRAQYPEEGAGGSRVRITPVHTRANTHSLMPGLPGPNQAGVGFTSALPQPRWSHLYLLLVAVDLPGDLHVHGTPPPRLLRQDGSTQWGRCHPHPYFLQTPAVMGPPRPPQGHQSPPLPRAFPTRAHLDHRPVRVRHLWRQERSVRSGPLRRLSPGGAGDTARTGPGRGRPSPGVGTGAH